MRVCKSITTYTRKGINVGFEKVWEKVVICLATGRPKKTPGVELVAFSRNTDFNIIAISTPLYIVVRMSLFNLGQGNALKNFSTQEQNVVKNTTLI